MGLIDALKQQLQNEKVTGNMLEKSLNKEEKTPVINSNVEAAKGINSSSTTGKPNIPLIEDYDGTPGIYFDKKMAEQIKSTMNPYAKPFVPRRSTIQSYIPPQLPQLPYDCNETPEQPMNDEELSLLNKRLEEILSKHQEETVDISEGRLDPNNPLHSETSFRDLNLRPELLQALELMEYETPSKIQEKALPHLLKDPPINLIAQAQSGTGKTAAFLLAMLSRVVVENEWPQCICLVPTLELVTQIGEVLVKMAKFMPGIKIHYAMKETKPPAHYSMKEPFIIGTPGKLIDYLTKFKCFDASKIICVVLDEADQMIDKGFVDLSRRIYNHIKAANPSVQTLLFSATYREDVLEFAKTLIKDPIVITLKKEEQPLKNIKQYFVECRDQNEKFKAVCNLYGGLCIASSVIFTNTKINANWLQNQLTYKGWDVAVLHGDLTIDQRAQSISDFKEGKYRILITTNVLARGINVPQVSIVINYDPPVIHDTGEPDYETYIHRIGRTGRFGKAGIAVNFVDSQHAMSIYKKIESHFGVPIENLQPNDMEQLEAIEKNE